MTSRTTSPFRAGGAEVRRRGRTRLVGLALASGLSVSGAALGVVAVGGTGPAAAASGAGVAQPVVGDPLADMCATTTLVDGLRRCTEFYAEGAPLRLPPGPGTGEVYGAIRRFGDGLSTADGWVLPLSPTLTPPDLSEYPTAVYLATLNDPALPTPEVVALTLVGTVDESALLTHELGNAELEGTIDARGADGSYGTSGVLQVRISLDPAAVDGYLHGHIVNLSEGVVGADGSCLAALNATDANPIVGPVPADFALYRAASMHAQFSDEMVMEWGDFATMGESIYPSVATVLGTDPIEWPWATMTHGAPFLRPAVTLTRVTAGGERCSAATTTTTTVPVTTVPVTTVPVTTVPVTTVPVTTVPVTTVPGSNTTVPGPNTTMVVPRRHGTPTQELAVTGRASRPLAALAVSLVLGGAAVMLFARRRNT